MRPLRSRRRRALLALLLGAVAAVAALVPAGARAPVARALSAQAVAPTSADTFQPELGLPATDVVALGAAPGEAAGEAWAYGTVGDVPATVDGTQIHDQIVLLERTDASGWQVVPLPVPAGGTPLDPSAYGVQAGRVTPHGGVVLLAGQNVVVRDPGLAPALAPAPGADVLAADESLVNPDPSTSGLTIPYAAVDEGNAQTGVLIAPYGDGGSGASALAPGVLHYNATAGWTREPIDVPADELTGFTPLALACGPSVAAPQTDAPGNCWLLATGGSSGVPTLFTRVASSDASGYSWEPESVNDWLLGAATPPGGATASGVSPLGQGAQMLTVTSQGVWVDFDATISGTPTDVSELIAPGAGSGAGTASPSVAPAAVDGTWCFPAGTACPQSLGGEFPAGAYRSFAWPGTSPADPGTRIITGLTDRGMLELSGAGSFTDAIGPGGTSSDDAATGGAAFATPTQGWIADGGSQAPLDQEGTPQVIDVTTTPIANALMPESVPFGAPLLAVTTAPGSTPGDPAAQDLAVGDDGQVARYTPGEGWAPEALLNSAGVAQTPTLRGVAWPSAGRAYAVGDNGAMWLWQKTTGLWEPDPAKPYNFVGNLTAIAFDPDNPDLGYAVGKQGVLLQFGKTWTQTDLPAALQNVNFTSVSFAGDEALATYRMIGGTANVPIETGGLAVNDGSGWQVDTGVAALLAGLPGAADTVLARVAGLPDGGAVAAGPGLVIERDTPGDVWQLSADPLPEAANVSALAAYRDASGAVRAIVSIDLDWLLDPAGYDNLLSSPFSGDVPYPTGTGQPPAFIPADPLPDSGYVVEQTANGWSDMEHMTFPGGQQDGPERPDPVLALTVSPDGSEGLAVGGQTGDDNGTGPDASAETASAMRFGTASTAASGETVAPVTTDSTQASFVLAGNAVCAQACAGDAQDGLTPDVSLSHAITETDGISGVRGFLYSGGRLAPGVAATLTDGQLTQELDREAQLLGGGNGTVPVYAASSADVLSSTTGLTPFETALASFVPGAGNAYYTFTSQGSSGPVEVIVLDYSAGSLGATQTAWLTQQLASAKAAGVPAIVMGHDALGFSLPDDPQAAPIEAADAKEVSQILVSGGASAYLFDYPQANVAATVSDGSGSIPAFGSGTLGYVQPPTSSAQTDDLGSSAFLVVSVQTADRNATTNVAPVTATAIPNIEQLAADATSGTLLRRSEVALFDGLARRVNGGSDYAPDPSTGGGDFIGPQVYDPIPFDCSGANCPFAIPEQFTFSSSETDIGNFVEHDATSSDPDQVALGSNGLPIADSSSGLFCAFNSGTTTVTLTAGGLSFSLPVTVQAGSVEAPCGTVPLTNPPAATTTASVPFTGFGAPSSPSTPAPHVTKVTPPAPPQPVVTHPHPHPQPQSHPQAAPQPVVKNTPPIHHPAPAPQPAPAEPPAVPNSPPAVAPVRPLVPPPAPSVARPTPPSGTAQVPSQAPLTQNAFAPEREREEVAATQSVHLMTAYDSDSPLPIPGWSVALIVVAAAAGGAGLRSRSRRDEPAWAGRPPASGRRWGR